MLDAIDRLPFVDAHRTIENKLTLTVPKNRALGDFCEDAPREANLHKPVPFVIRRVDPRLWRHGGPLRGRQEAPPDVQQVFAKLTFDEVLDA